VAEEHALGMSRAARRVLDEGGVGARALRRGPGRSGGRQLAGGGHGAERGNPGLQHAGHRGRAGHGDEELDLGVAEDRGLPRRVFLDPVETHRRVDGDGDRARDQDPLERAQEVRARGQHQRDGVALADTALAEAPGHGRRVAQQPAVGERRLRAVLLAHEDMGPVGGGLRALPEGAVHGGGRGGERRRRGQGRRGRSGRARGLAGRRADRAGQLRGSVRLQRRLVEPAAESGLDAQQQLHALQAAQAGVPLQRGPRRERTRRAPAAQLEGQGTHHLEDPVLDRIFGGDGGGRGVGHGIPLYRRGGGRAMTP
jgi:hypothetical protein